MAVSHELEAGIRAEPVEAEQEATMQYAAIQMLAFRATSQVLRETHLVVGFL
jgi:hypothetical protein